MAANIVKLASASSSAQPTVGCDILPFPQRSFPQHPSPQRQPRAPIASGLEAGEWRRLETLRCIARQSALAARPCRLASCKAFGVNTASCEEFCAAEQFRAFLDAAQTRLTLYRPGAAAASFDELWLLRLIAALACGDVSQASGLVSFRVARANRRAALAAASAVTMCLDPFADGASSVI